MFFVLTFDDEMKLDKSLFAFTQNGGKKIDFDIAYASGNTSLPKHAIKLTPK